MLKLRVPATSANMGPGFDCLGIALNMYNHYYIEEIDSGIQWEGCEEQYKNKDNLLYVSMQSCFERIGYTPKGLKIKMECNIPISRGLGSSAACIVAGVVAANELAGGVLNQKELLELATEIEGHPDNIAPALFGGMLVSVKEKSDVYFDRLKIAEGLKFCAIIPDFSLSTKTAREVLPKQIPYEHGVFNVGRTALMISALVSGKFELLKLGCEDKLHQIYRGELIENYKDIVEKCKELNSLGVFLSGAGPTIMVALRKEETQFYNGIKEFLRILNSKWTVTELIPSFEGVVVNRI